MGRNESLAIQYNLNIINIGSVNHSEMLKIEYVEKISIRIKNKSYGLPIEAKEMGLDIIA